MKRVFSPVLAVLLLSFSGTTFAADQVRWVGTIEEAMKQAKERGSLIFVGLVHDGDGDPANLAQNDQYADPAFVRAAQNFVCVYANPTSQHGTVKVTVDGESVERCRVTRSTVCREHAQAYNEAYRNYSELFLDSTQAGRMPVQFVIDPSGKVIEFQALVNGSKETGFEPMPAASMAAVMNALVARLGRGLTATQYEELTATLEAADQCRTAGELEKAISLYRKVITANERTSLATRAREGMEAISKGGEEALTEALAKKDTDALETVIALEGVIERYRGTEAGDHAKAALDELRRKPEVRAALVRLASEKEAVEKLAKAEAAAEKKDYGAALSLFDEIVKRFADSSASAKAKARAEEIRADESIMAALLEKEAAKVCRGLLSIARSYAQNGMKDHAIAKYREVIDRYPGTSFAATAAEEMEKLK